MKLVRLAACVIFMCLNDALTSRTFFSVRPPFLPGSVERQGATHDVFRDYCTRERSVFSVTPFGGRSTCSDKLASYFLPFGKSEVICGELGSRAVKDETADVVANYFNVLTDKYDPAADSIFNDTTGIGNWTFESRLRFEPVHEYFGLGLLYHRHLSANLDKGLWFELAMPIVFVKNDMGLCEKIICPGSSGASKGSFFKNVKNPPRNMREALASGKFFYGKIDECESKTGKWGISDIEFRLGYIFLHEPRAFICSYLGILVPTGNKPTGEYVFEKIVGPNGHAGFFLGSEWAMRVWQNERDWFAFHLETVGTLWLDNQQVRSIDLRGKPWSRYIWAYRSALKETPIIPGINLFTRSVWVNRGPSRDLNVAGVVAISNLQGEAGYHFNASETERIRLAKPWPSNVALTGLWTGKNIFWNSSEPQHISRNNQTINESLRILNDCPWFEPAKDPNPDAWYVTQDTYRQLGQDQLDFDSGAHPATISHTLYLALSYYWQEATYPGFVSFGGGYEFGRGDHVMDRLQLWMQAGVSF